MLCHKKYFLILLQVIVLVATRRLLALEENINLDTMYSEILGSFTSCHLLVLLIGLNTAFFFSFSYCQYLSFISSISHNYLPLNIIRIVPRHLNFE